MAKKLKEYEVIAFWDDDGNRYFKIGKKINKDEPLCSDNVEWKVDKKGKPIKTDDYNQALKLCK